MAFRAVIKPPVEPFVEYYTTIPNSRYLKYGNISTVYKQSPTKLRSEGVDAAFKRQMPGFREADEQLHASRNTLQSHWPSSTCPIAKCRLDDKWHLSEKLAIHHTYTKHFSWYSARGAEDVGYCRILGNLIL